MKQYYEESSKPCCNQQMADSLHGLVPAMAYVPWQYYQTIYEPDKALREGTIFPELNKPFLGKRVNNR